MRTEMLAVKHLCAVLLVLGPALVGCGFDPSSVPLPGTTVSGQTYRVHIEFANALNLPARAKVASNGVQVGTLRSVTLVDATSGHPGYVVADVDIKESVALPTATTAELRQATLLGDIYIALITPRQGFEVPIPHDGTIALSHTKPPVQVEDTLAGLATFVNGGAMHQIHDIINQVNSALPSEPKEAARISGVLGADVQDLAANLTQVDAFLDGMNADAAVVLDNSPALSELLTDAGVAQTTDSMSSIVGVLGVFGALGQLAHALEWVAPLASAGDAAAKAFVPLAFTGRPLDLNAPSNLNKLVALLRDKLIPFVEHGPNVNIVSASIADSPAAQEVSPDDQTDRIIDTLRMIGAVR
jgi:phospholipid/cholesterol/gamma-HCH transport system substrate-binding protein